MKGNFKTMQSFLDEVARREQSKEDYFVPTNKSLMVDDSAIELESIGSFGLTELAHRQIADRLNIPKKYYDKMRQEMPGLLSHNVNSWFHDKPENRLVRTLDGNVRAYLSDRYKQMDNFFIMAATYPILKKNQDLMVMSHSLTDNKMYLQLQFPSIQGEVEAGDMVTAGVVITNSEVGLGALDISEMIWRLSCTNGLVTGTLKRQTHLGGSIGYELYYKKDTMKKRLEALQLEIRDVLKEAISNTSFEQNLEKLRKAKKDEVTASPTDFIKKVTKRFRLSDVEGDNIILNMMREDNLNRYGLMNGITALAHETDSRDKQYEYECLGNDVIKLRPHEWEVLAS